jgi:peptide/nickel transport system substrate-binding protein
LLVILAGCAPHAAQPRSIKGGDGTLRLSFIGEPQTLNPNIGPDEAALVITTNLFNRLISLASDGNVIPELAERWDEADDGLSYTFYLRSDVRWHDGRPLTAEDVRVTLLRVTKESVNREVGSRIADVTVPRPQVVVVRLDKPWAAFLPSFAWYGTSILPAHIYGQNSWANHPANLQPVGTGPFKLKLWEPGKRIVVERNDDYFGPGPYLDQVEYRFAATAEESAEHLLRGDVDLLMGRPPAPLLEMLTKTPGLRVAIAPGDGRTYLTFNLRRQPLDDIRVRRAINMAIDRRAIVDEALAGLGAPATGFYTPAVAWAYNGNARAPAYDPAGARRLVASSVPPGYVATLLCSTHGSGALLAEKIGAQLGAVGLRVRTRAVPPQEYFRLIFESHDFDLAVLAGSQGPDPDALTARFASNGGSQVMGYSNTELDSVLARGGTSSDMSVRSTAYFRAQEILAEDLPIAPLVENVRVTISRAGIRGLPQDDARGLVPEFMYNLVRLPAKELTRLPNKERTRLPNKERTR